MPVGFEGSGGVMAGYGALAEIIAARKKDELIRQKHIEEARKFELEQQEEARRQQQQEEQVRQFEVTNDRLSEEAGIARKRQKEQDTVALGGRIQSTSNIGDQLTPDQIVTLIKAGDRNVLAPTPITSTPGLVEKMGERPTQTESGGQLIYGGNAAQQHTAKADTLATQRYEESKRAAEAAARRGDRALSISEQRLNLAEQNADQDTNIVERQPDGSYKVVATVPKGSKLAPNPQTTFQRNQAASRTAAASTIHSIAELSERINVNQGVVAKLTGTAEHAKAAANLNDDVSEYESLIAAFTPLVARALGHTGVLTQPDVDSTREYFPKVTDSKSLRDRKVKRLMAFLGEEAPAGGDGGDGAGEGDVTIDANGRIVKRTP